MRRDEALTKLRELKPWLEAQGVVRTRLYGSHARDAAGAESDIDLIVDFTSTPDLFSFAGLQQELSNLLGASVDLTTETGLHQKLRAQVLASAIDA